MKGLKKLFSAILGIFTLVTSMPSVFATKKVENALVIGTEASQRKFTRLLFGGERMLGNFYYSECDEKNDINLAITFDYRKHSQVIANYIRNGQINEDFYLEKFEFKGILATVDADQEMDKIKEDMKNILDFICEHKPDYTQVLIVGCTDRENVDSRDDFFNKLANYTCRLERRGTEIGWGSKQDIHFSDDCQFLGFFTLKNSKVDKLKSKIVDLAQVYDYYYNHTIYSKKKLQEQCVIS